MGLYVIVCGLWFDIVDVFGVCDQLFLFCNVGMIGNCLCVEIGYLCLDQGLCVVVFGLNVCLGQ